MKKINKTVLLASTLFITSAINLADNSYANEDEKLLVKESVDKLSEDTEDSAYNAEAISEENQKNEENNQEVNLELEDNDISLEENDQANEDVSEQSADEVKAELEDPSKEVGSDSNTRIPGVIYYNAIDLDEAIDESNNSTTEIRPNLDESGDIKEEKYFSGNAGGYFVEKNNVIKYYKNNKLVKNANIRINDSIFSAGKNGAISNPKNYWLNIDKDIYYNDGNGDIVKGITQIGKDRYYFSDDGILQINKKLVTQGYYYEVNSMGRINTVKNQWVNINSNIYRTLNDGKIAKGVTRIGDKDYMFDKDGKLQTDKKMLVSGKYYEVDPMGVVTNPKNKWLTIDGLTYRTIGE